MDYLHTLTPGQPPQCSVWVLGCTGKYPTHRIHKNTPSESDRTGPVQRHRSSSGPWNDPSRWNSAVRAVFFLGLFKWFLQCFTHPVSSTKSAITSCSRPSQRNKHGPCRALSHFLIYQTFPYHFHIVSHQVDQGPWTWVVRPSPTVPPSEAFREQGSKALPALTDGTTTSQRMER